MRGRERKIEAVKQSTQ
uniref:Uncharacterized protein n=1 Tax=Anguilla anguilla TaxID=7936 RepID=A0A0E9S946_ANGAN